VTDIRVGTCNVGRYRAKIYIIWAFIAPGTNNLLFDVGQGGGRMEWLRRPFFCCFSASFELLETTIPLFFYENTHVYIYT
jgi:hypothetical protein